MVLYLVVEKLYLSIISADLFSITFYNLPLYYGRKIYVM
nr:MAG TPA: hypothetical protein [Bacteriophage sp.]